ncbi:BnaA06g20430D [Brassica napus]|uniref:(rape) hypothetical protein n=1 Tax=Brassica napus TaxID=3708 RepID=A0A078G8Q4_BRANA|nr:unnamed protein product [Brassica napus]CDY21774.1 BnaA06g20430D [Brassica napus]
MEKHTIDGRTVPIINPSFNFIFCILIVPRDDLVWIRHLLKAPAADDDDDISVWRKKELQRRVRLLRRTPRSPKRVSLSFWLRYQEARDHQLYTKLE